MNDVKKFYAVQRFENSADIYIFGDIVEERWFEEEVSPTSLISEIKGLDVPEIHVHVNSYGGSVSGGWAIYNALRESKAKIITYADGFVCSAANYPFLAGDERHASPVSAFFLHNVSTGAYGYAEDLRKAADEIEKLTEIGINAFVERTGLEKETVQELMNSESWLTPEEALQLGIATDIVSAQESEGYGQSAQQKVMQLVFSRPAQTVETPENEPEPEPEPQQEKPDEGPQPESVDFQPEKTVMQRLAGFYNA